MKYTEERRETVLKKLLPLHNRTVASLAEEEGINGLIQAPKPERGYRTHRNLIIMSYLIGARLKAPSVNP